MRILVGTTPQAIAGTRSRLLIQNLGPGTVYLDTDGDVDADAGFKLDPTAAYEFPTPGADSNIIVVATEADTDVRVIKLG